MYSKTIKLIVAILFIAAACKKRGFERSALANTESEAGFECVSTVSAVFSNLPNGSTKLSNGSTTFKPIRTIFYSRDSGDLVASLTDSEYFGVEVNCSISKNACTMSVHPKKNGGIDLMEVDGYVVGLPIFETSKQFSRGAKKPYEISEDVVGVYQNQHEHSFFSDINVGYKFSNSVARKLNVRCTFKESYLTDGAFSTEPGADLPPIK